MKRTITNEWLLQVVILPIYNSCLYITPLPNKLEILPSPPETFAFIYSVDAVLSCRKLRLQFKHDYAYSHYFSVFMHDLSGLR